MSLPEETPTKHYNERKTMNNEDTKIQPQAGTNIFTVVGVVFIILKLTGVIDWSWWWVLSPFWILVALSIILIGITALLLPFLKPNKYR